jgi:hypothetical protein
MTWYSKWFHWTILETCQFDRKIFHGKKYVDCFVWDIFMLSQVWKMWRVLIYCDTCQVKPGPRILQFKHLFLCWWNRVKLILNLKLLLPGRWIDLKRVKEYIIWWTKDSLTRILRNCNWISCRGYTWHGISCDLRETNYIVPRNVLYFAWKRISL